MSRMIRWTDFPKQPVFSIEYSGEPAYGKTHCVFTYPDVAVCDTPGEGKAWIVAQKFNNPRVFKARTFDDIRRFVDYCVANPKIKSIGIDSGSDLREMAETEWLREKGRKSVYVPGEGAFQWAEVYEKIDKLVQKIKDANKYFVVTSRLKDEWVETDAGEGRKSVKTGRRVRDGYKKFPFGLTVLIELTDGIKIDDETYFEGHVFGRVIKNGFLCPRVQKPYFFDPTYQGLVENRELFIPFCKNYSENCQIINCARCENFEPKDLLEEAKAYLRRIGFLKDEPKPPK